MSSSFPAFDKNTGGVRRETVFTRPNNWNKGPKGRSQMIGNSSKTNEWETLKKDAAGREVERQRQRGRDSRDGLTGLWREELNFPTPSVTSPWVESSTYVKPPTTTHTTSRATQSHERPHCLFLVCPLHLFLLRTYIQQSPTHSHPLQ